MGNEIGRDQITVSTSSVGFTAANVPGNAMCALISVATARVNKGSSGEAPTATKGVTFNPGGGFVFVGPKAAIVNLRFIRVDGADATVDGRFYDSFDFPVVAFGGLQGLVASDEPEQGNPVQIGGSVDNTSPAGAAEGDVRRIRSTPDGHLLVTNAYELATYNDAVTLNRIRAHDQDDTTDDPIWPVAAYLLAPDGNLDKPRSLGDSAGSGLGVLAAAPWIPGASDVKSKTVQIGATSGSINTALDPTSGKKIRLLSYRVVAEALSTDPDRVGVYFGTGAAYVTNAASAIGEGQPGTTGSFGESWPDGGGPVGAADDNLSWITETETETALWITFHYREE